MKVLQDAEELFRANRIKGFYLDSYKERAIEQFLCARNLALRDGKTLEPTDVGVFSLLAMRD